MMSQIHQRIFPSSSLAHDCVWARLRLFFEKEASTSTPPPRERWLPCSRWLTLLTVSATVMVLASPGVLIRASTIPFGRHDIARRRQKNRVERKDRMLLVCLVGLKLAMTTRMCLILFCFGMWQWGYLTWIASTGSSQMMVCNRDESFVSWLSSVLCVSWRRMHYVNRTFLFESTYSSAQALNLVWSRSCLFFDRAPASPGHDSRYHFYFVRLSRRSFSIVGIDSVEPQKR